MSSALITEEEEEPYGVILMSLVSNCPKMPAWDQRIPLSGHVKEIETSIKYTQLPCLSFILFSNTSFRKIIYATNTKNKFLYAFDLAT